MDNRKIADERLLWDPRNEWGKGQFWVANWYMHTTSYLNDGSESDQIGAVCDLLESETANFDPNL